MIPATKQRVFNAWFSNHARDRLERAFGRIRVHGLAETVRALADAPLLVISNHTSWWDPLAILHASEHLLHADGHALMDAANLERLPFFALVGAFGVDRTSPRDGARAIRYAARLLDRPGRLVWIFPQGRERPITERPLGFQPGSAELARIAKRAVTVPAALRYEHGEEEKPALYLSFGAPIPGDRDVARGQEAQARAVEAELARIDDAARGDATGFVDVHRAPPATGDGFAAAALAMLTRAAFLFDEPRSK